MSFSKPKLIFIVSGCFMLLLLYWATFTSPLQNAQKPRSGKFTSSTKFVLYWSPFWFQKDYYYGYGFDPFRNCSYKNCYATDSRTFMPLEEFDALMFHGTYQKEGHGVPWVRAPHQVYIFMNVEPPAYTYLHLKDYASYFNWTMTYRYDSDIVWRYGYITREKTAYQVPSREFLRNKTKLAAWFVSNCKTEAKRDLLTKEIQKFIPVDVYGSCGELACTRNSKECYEMLERTYKFYFSFENSYCRDYSTEKLYKVLQKNVVPVVYGGDNYTIRAPPYSVVNVDNFQTVEQLADYLMHLDANDEQYLKYFDWKKDYVAVASNTASACQLCQKLHETSEEKTYDDLYEWWLEKNKSVCKTGKALPKIVSDLL